MLLVAIVILALVFSKAPTVVQTSDGTELRVFSSLGAKDQLQAYRGFDRVIVSPGFLSGSSNSGQLANAATIAVVLAAGNDQNVVQVYRELSPSGDLVSCLSNAGDPKIVNALSKQDCESLLSNLDEKSLLIKLDLQANPNDPLSMALLRDRSLEFFFAPSVSADHAVFGVLQGVYPNAGQVLLNANAFLNKNSNAVSTNRS